MEERLTRYLEYEYIHIPYYMQVNICHDVALALSYLHLNQIVHRCVCSNDILLAGRGLVSKLGGFGPSTFNISNGDDLIMCPGNFAYMPPEAMIEKPRYTEKIDCFSFGVVMIQVLTRERPEPGPQTEHVNIHINIEVTRNIPEIERRQSCTQEDRSRPRPPTHRT